MGCHTANNELMHIAFITSEYPHPEILSAAGIGTSIKNLAEALIRANVKVTVFVYGQTQNKVFIDANIKFHLIENKHYCIGKWLFYRRHINKYINQTIKEEGISILEAADWTGITATMKFKIPLIIRFHGSDTYFCHLEGRRQKWKNYLFERIAVKAADALIAPTNFAGKISSQLFDIGSNKVKVINHGVDLNLFQNNCPSQFQKGVILYIGTMIRKKGVLELPGIFRAVRKINPGATLVLIGADCPDTQTEQGSTWQLMRSDFDSEDLKNVSYLGKIPYDAVQKHIQNANVCVFPTFAETLGMVTIESMAMQKAVVNSDIGWAIELMEDGISGFLVSPKDHILFADRIVSILDDEALTLEMGKSARKYIVNNFNIKDKVIENILFYNKVLRDDFSRT